MYLQDKLAYFVGLFVTFSVNLGHIDRDQILTTLSGGRHNGLVLYLWLCDVRKLLASKLDINIQ